MAGEQDLLNDLLRLQGEIRAMEQEDYSFSLEEPEPGQRHGGIKGSETFEQRSELAYTDASPASIPPGSLIVQSPANDPGGLIFADHPRPERNKDGSWSNIPCANGTNCIGVDFCYSDWDCDECSACVDFQCVERDPNRPCLSDGDCPCAPSDEQSYVCDSGACKLTCLENSDCPLGQACDLDTFLCGPGCESDDQCNPNSPNAAPDAKSNSICVNFECVRPCEPDVICDGPNDTTTCPEGTYCTERVGRAPGDPVNAIYFCESGCSVDSQCRPDVFTRRCDTDANPDCEDEEVEFDTFCVDNSCIRPCNSDSECATEFDEACVEGTCQTVGAICLGDSDCDEGNYCNEDGRCAGGCRANADCRKQCPPLSECLETCPPDPTCTCEQITGDGDICDPNDNTWQEFCPRDPACAGRCPRDPGCLESYSPDAVCSENQCIVPCPCEQGFRCETPEGKEPRCVNVVAGGSIERCWQWTEETVDEDGNIEIIEKQDCAFVSPKLDDEYFGCNCGEKCTTQGACAPGVCLGDSDCESCSYCKDGVCVPGCDEENPCPAGECCQNDGRCHLLCSSDSDCPDPEMCLAGGCCGIACDPIIPCNKSEDCEEGSYCSGAGVCESGCKTDTDCESGEICYQFNCEQSCAGGCDEGSTCGPNGFCVNTPDTCRNDNDCDDGICKDGRCTGGCRSDGDCGKNGFCNNNSCTTYCLDNAECASQNTEDQTSKCRSDAGTRESVRKRYEALKWMKNNGKAYDQAELSRYESLVLSGRAGKCVLQSSGYDSPDGRTGCECYEDCDEKGRCERRPCQSTSSCECGDCLTDNLCGFCRRDSDCRGEQVCDIPEGESVGACGVPCIPETPCRADGDCPTDSYCRPDPFGRTVEQGGGAVCIQGCRDDSGCLPGQACRDNDCVNACSADSECNTDTERCIRGGCVEVGFTCISDGDCPAGQGWCLNGYCAEDIRCSSDGDCNSSEVCNPDTAMCEQGQRCSSSNDCKATCESDLDCGNKVCESNDDCTGDGETCSRVGGTGICVGGADFTACNTGLCVGGKNDTRYCDTRGVCQQGQACSSDNDCAFPKTCFEGGCQFKRRCNGDSQCEVGEFCDQGFCGGDNRCGSDFDCVDGYKCNQSGRCFKDDDSQEVIQLGCESCDQFCNPNTFRCQQIVCAADEDCPCGACEGGQCVDDGGDGDECESDADCEGGKCLCDGTGEERICQCVECRNDQDCKALYDEDDLVCADNVCQTPCYTGLSTGDCFAGLNYGDTCGNCPDKCPGNSSCVTTETVCGTYQVFEGGKALTRPILCKKCVGGCNSSADCEGEAVCGPGGICVPFDGRCDTDLDCQAYASKEGLQMYCQENQCIEAETCIGNSDCDAAQLCIGATCRNASCAGDEDCAEGSTCIDGGCAFQCEVQALTCECSTDPYEPGVLCPQGYNCNCQTNLCTRDGYAGIEPTMDDCPRGYYCDSANKACRAFKQGELECFSDSDCGESSDRRCEQGLCKSRDSLGQPVPDPSLDPRDDPQAQDNCERKDLCCGDDGFCVACACDDEHPCGQGQCCDGASGVCVDTDSHPDTKYGAPGGCSFDKVYCEILGPGGDDGNRSTIRPSEFKGRGFAGCEFSDLTEDGYPMPAGQRRKICWEGGDPSDSQIIELLKQECDPEEEKDCSCDDTPPDEDECFQNKDCGNCMVCESKTWQSTPCCPVADDFGNDFVTKNICKPIDGLKEAPEECGCMNDSECGPCEVCIARPGADRGVCEANCEELCPCGGELSTGGKCPDCETQFGPCTEGIDLTVEPPRVDPETGQIVPAKTQCACRVKRENPCCEAFESVEDTKSARDGCIFKQFSDQDGTTSVTQVNYCSDFQSGTCAQCTEDSHCIGNQVCSGYKCVSQCGNEDAIASQVGNCSCCTDDGTCRELYESWSESRDSEGGGQTRPCACTENGVDCGPYQDAESCYVWVKEDGEEGGDGDQAKANRDQNLAQLEEYQSQEPELRENYAAALVAKDEACLGGGSPRCEFATNQLSLTEQALNNNLTYQQGLSTQLQETVYRPASYRQVRKCNCCVDGQCRPDEECSYGTCYVCIAEATPYYRAALYTNVLENEVCTGCTDLDGGPPPAGCPDNYEYGTNAVYFEANVGDCVKYRCEDGISVTQELCDGIQSSWYEYCYGSIIGCVFSCNNNANGALSGNVQSKNTDSYNYWNGWEYLITCGKAGLWFFNENSSGSAGNALGDWVNLTQPEVASQKAACAYPNPIGCIQGNWLPTFEDLVQIHPCCHKANVYSECDPEHPNCQAKLEFLFEKGDTSGMIDRLKKQLGAIERYEDDLDRAVNEVRMLESNKRAERADLLSDLQAVEQGADDLRDAVEAGERRQEELEGDIKEQEGKVEDAKEDLDEALADRDEKGDERDDAISERDDLQEELTILNQDYSLASSNYASAKEAYEQKAGEVRGLEKDVIKKKQLQVDQGCVCPEGVEDCEPPNADSLDCFDLEQELIALEDDLTEAQGERDNLEGEKDAYQDEKTELGKQANDLQTEVDKKEGEVQRLQQQWQTLQTNVGTYTNKLDGEIGVLGTLNQDLLDNNKELDRNTKQLERAENTDTGQKQDLEAAIQKIDNFFESVADFDDQIMEAREEVAKQKDEKEAEIARLEEQFGIPVVPVASSRPDDGKTEEELKEFYDDIIKEDEARGEDPWYPGR